MVAANSADSHEVAREAVEYIRSQFLGGEAQWIVATDVQRMLVATEGDIQLARSKLCDAVRWKLETLDAWLAKDDDSRGDHRVVANGQQGRPFCYGSAHHQRAAHNLAADWACTWHKAISESPNPFEQVDVCLDCSGFQPLLNLSIRNYLRLAPALDSFFAERIHRVVFIDFPSVAQFIWTGVKPFLPPKTVQKIVFINRSVPGSLSILDDIYADEEMRQFIDDLLSMNEKATKNTGREPSHTFSANFLRRQRAAAREGQESPDQRSQSSARN